MGMKRTVKHPSMVFPHAIPMLWKSGTEARGIPAPIMDRTKSFEASTEAAEVG